MQIIVYINWTLAMSAVTKTAPIIPYCTQETHSINNFVTEWKTGCEIICIIWVYAWYGDTSLQTRIAVLVAARVSHWKYIGKRLIQKFAIFRLIWRHQIELMWFFVLKFKKSSSSQKILHVNELKRIVENPNKRQ